MDEAPFVFTVRIPFPNAEWARIVLNTISVDTELRESIVTRTYAVEDAAFIARFSAANPRTLRTSIKSFWEMLSLAVKTIEQFAPAQ